MTKDKDKPPAPAPAPDEATDEPKPDETTTTAEPKGSDESPADDPKADGAADKPKDQADQDQESLPTQAPASAQVDPPPPPAPKDNPTPESTGLTDAAAEKLRVNPRTPYLRDERGNKLDSNKVFSEPDARGFRVAQVRIIQHTTATLGRPVATQLIAPGQAIAAPGAEAILTNIRAERA